MIFERKELEVVDFDTPFWMSVPAIERCELVVGGEKMEEVKEFKYLRTVQCKFGEMEGEIRKADVL